MLRTASMYITSFFTVCLSAMALRSGVAVEFWGILRHLGLAREKQWIKGFCAKVACRVAPHKGHRGQLRPCGLDWGGNKTFPSSSRLRGFPSGARAPRTASADTARAPSNFSNGHPSRLWSSRNLLSTYSRTPQCVHECPRSGSPEPTLSRCSHCGPVTVTEREAVKGREPL